MGSPNTKPPKLKLLSSDGKVVEADEEAARKFGSIKDFLDSPAFEVRDAPIRIGDVNAKTLRRMLQWCKRHAEAEAKAARKGKFTENDARRLEKWDAEFAKGLGDVFVMQVALAADYLGAPELASLATGHLAEVVEEECNVSQEETVKRRDDQC